jgi:hypothetical protein
MMHIKTAILVIVIFSRGVGTAQEIRYIDLSGIDQPTGDKPSGSRVDYSRCGPSNEPFPHQAMSSLEWIDATDLYPHQRVEIEVLVKNTGTADLKLPIYPNLMDLTHQKPSEQFEYYNLRLPLVAASLTLATLLGSLQLYGVFTKPDTFVSLKPGEWIRVKGDIVVQRWFANDRTAIASTGFVLYRYISPGKKDTAIPTNASCTLPVDGSTITIQMHPRRDQ